MQQIPVNRAHFTVLQDLFSSLLFFRLFGRIFFFTFISIFFKNVHILAISPQWNE